MAAEAQDTLDSKTAGAGTRNPADPDVPGHGSVAGTIGRRHLPYLAPAALLVLHLLLTISRSEPAISAPDANGYWAQGSLLAATGHTWFRAETAPQYVGIHWLALPDGRYVSRYPPGLSVLVGLVFRFCGAEASLLINPVLATLTLLGLYLLIGLLAPRPWALVSTAALGLSPTFNHHALVCDSHMAVAFCLAWGLFLLVSWSQQGGLPRIFAAGLLFGAIPTIRYPEALFAIGVAALLATQWRSRPRIWIHYSVAAAGAAVPIILLLLRNHVLFGAFWETAYALTNEQTGFSLTYFREHSLNYLSDIHGEGLGPFFTLGVVGMVLMCGLHRTRAAALALAGIALPVTVLYMCYYWPPRHQPGAAMRFLMPTFVCYACAAAWALSAACAKLPRRLAFSLAAVLLLLQAAWAVGSQRARPRWQQHQKKVLAELTAALRDNTARGDVIMAHPQVLQHLDFVREWRLVDTTLLSAHRLPRGRGGQTAETGDPAPMQAGKREAQVARYEGLRPFEWERQAAYDICDWAGGSRVFFAGTEDELRGLPRFYFAERYFRKVAELPWPSPSEPDAWGPFPPGGPDPAPPGGGRPRGPDRQPRGARPFPGGPMPPPGRRQAEGPMLIAEWTWRPAQAPKPAGRVDSE